MKATWPAQAWGGALMVFVTVSDAGQVAPAPDTIVVPRGEERFARTPKVGIPIFRTRRTERGEFDTLTKGEIFAELSEITGLVFTEPGGSTFHLAPFIDCRYERYGVVDHGWFRNLIRLLQLELQFHGLTFRRDYWDCDDYCASLDAFVDLSWLNSSDPVRPPPQLYGSMVVNQVLPWGANTTLGIHALVLFRSEQSWWVVDPQNGMMEPLATYPNRSTIREILFR